MTLRVSDAAAPRISVAGNSVEPCETALDTVPYANALQAALGYTPMEAYSRDTKTLVAPNHSGSAHSFIAAAQAAYANHYPLVLSPDAIWLLIAQGFARHVRQNSEALRHHFVSHQGKATITVLRADFIPSFAGNDWEDVFTEFSEKIRGHVGGATHELLVPAFSTTGRVEKAAFEITLMDTLQNYFYFEMGIICGIPQFIFEGTPADWKRLREHAAALERFDLDWWIPSLLILLDECIAASEGRGNQDFWRRFYKYEGGCGTSFVNGHVLKLFPYLPSCDEETFDKAVYDSGDYTRREAMQKELALIEDPDEYVRRWEWMRRELQKAPANTFVRNRGLNSPRLTEIAPRRFPAGLSSVPFDLFIGNDKENKESMEFVAGFVGMTQEEGTLALRPEIGWAVREVAKG
jgi:hypothetical protein